MTINADVTNENLLTGIDSTNRKSGRSVGCDDDRDLPRGCRAGCTTEPAGRRIRTGAGRDARAVAI